MEIIIESDLYDRYLDYQRDETYFKYRLKNFISELLHENFIFKHDFMESSF
jgi:hypothetical protein